MEKPKQKDGLPWRLIVANMRTRLVSALERMLREAEQSGAVDICLRAFRGEVVEDAEKEVVFCPLLCLAKYLREKDDVLIFKEENEISKRKNEKMNLDEWEQQEEDDDSRFTADSCLSSVFRYCGEEVRFSRGDVIITANATNEESVFYLLEGQVDCVTFVKLQEDGGEEVSVLLSELTVGEVFGEVSAIFKRTPRSCSVVCTSSTAVTLCLSGNQYRSHLAIPRFRGKFLGRRALLETLVEHDLFASLQPFERLSVLKAVTCQELQSIGVELSFGGSAVIIVLAGIARVDNGNNLEEGNYFVVIEERTAKESFYYIEAVNDVGSVLLAVLDLEAVVSDSSKEGFLSNLKKQK